MAQAIAAGLNGLQLSEHYHRVGRAEQATARWSEAQAALRQALELTKELATRLRLADPDPDPDPVPDPVPRPAADPPPARGGPGSAGLPDADVPEAAGLGDAAIAGETVTGGGAVTGRDAASGEGAGGADVPGTGIPGGVDAPGAPVELSEVFLVLREAVGNALAHAGARTITIRLRTGRERLVASVEDDGRGVARDRLVSPASLGLRSMRERTELLGGTFRLAPAAPTGTRVAISVPKGAR